MRACVCMCFECSSSIGACTQTRPCKCSALFLWKVFQMCSLNHMYMTMCKNSRDRKNCFCTARETKPQKHIGRNEISWWYSNHDGSILLICIYTLDLKKSCCYCIEISIVGHIGFYATYTYDGNISIDKFWSLKCPTPTLTRTIFFRDTKGLCRCITLAIPLRPQPRLIPQLHHERF